MGVEEDLASLSYKLAHLAVFKNGIAGDSTTEKAFRSLYYLAASTSEQYKYLFPQSKVKSIPTTWEYSVRSKWEVHAHYVNEDNRSHSHKGRNCGSKFKVGEPIYRCLDCGFDATCVLCVHCFNRDDHSGHRIVSSPATDTNSGICDCGDPEAWTKELHCQSEKSDSNKPTFKFDEELKDRLKSIYDACLEFIIKVFVLQDQTLPAVKRRFRHEINTKASGGDVLAAVFSGAKKLFQQVSPNDMTHMGMNEEYSLYFWNDEFHNFPAARDAIIAASGVSDTEAMNLASEIDSEGRAALSSSIFSESLVDGFEDATRTNFTASIISSTEKHRQELAKILVSWISNTVNHSDPVFQAISRRAFCESLCSEYTVGTAFSSSWDTANHSFDTYTGLLHGGYLPDPACVDTPSSFTKSTRLQYLLFLDVRFWKTLRRNLHTVLITTLVSDLEYKRIACSQIVEIYPLLFRNLSSLDREPHLNVMEEISTQFFTCPTNSSDVVSHSLMNLLSPIHDVLLSFLTTIHGVEVFRYPKQVNDHSTSKRTSVKRTLSDLDYILDKSSTLEPIYTKFELFSSLFKIIGIFDRCWQIQRKVGDHVQTESFEYVTYLNLLVNIIKLINSITSTPNLQGLDPSVLKRPIQKLISTITNRYDIRTKVVKQVNIIEFKTSEEYSSFMNPSLNLLGKLLSKYSTSTEVLRECLGSFDFLPVSDIALRTIVLHTQIECSFWIRNGNEPSSLAGTYSRHIALRDSSYFMDIYLTQLSLLACDPSRAMLNIIDRFELMDWFNHEVELDDTIYEEKINNIVERFISFLYALLTFRDKFIQHGSMDEELANRYRNFLTYTLFVGPKPYSDLEYMMSDDDFNSELFEKALADVCVFNPPRGLNDDGFYSLKPELFKQVDPLHLEAQTVDFNKSFTSLAKELATDTKGQDDIVIKPFVPKLENFPELGDFTRTIEFAKLVAKLLDYTLIKENESFAPVVLHLLHAAIIDDSYINGKDHTIDTFNQVPICENLFSIATHTNFTKSTKTKADHILSTLIKKDSESVLETLTSCFGETRLNNYKEQKRDAGVYFDETEADRKRRLAKERQKKILEKMQKKQKQFLDKNADTGKIQNEEDSEVDSHTCVLCQGPATKDEFLCAPLSVSNNNVFRNVSTNDEFFFQRAFTDWGNDTVEAHRKTEGLSDFSSSSVRVLRVGSSCNHHVHYKCLSNYLRENNSVFKDVSCPLCKTKHDTYVPVLNRATGDDVPDIKLSPKYIHHLAGSADSPNSSKQLDEIFKSLPKHLALSETEAYSTEVCSFLSNSIGQAEIATRVNGSSSYFCFLNQVPEQIYKSLTLMLQFWALMETKFPSATPELKINTASKSQDFLTCVLLDYWYGKLSHEEVAIKWTRFFFQVYLSGFLNNYIPDKCGSIDGTAGRVLSDEDAEVFRTALQEVGDLNDSSNISKFLSDVDFLHAVVSKVEKILLLDLRNLALLYKLLDPAFDLVIEDDGVAPFGPDVLLAAMGFPSILDILSAKADFKHHYRGSDGAYLPYPGVIKLVDLPMELDYFTGGAGPIADDLDPYLPRRFKVSEKFSNSLQNRMDYAICLSCGRKFLSTHRESQQAPHLDSIDCCRSGCGVSFYPSNNSIRINAIKGNYLYSKKLNAPYLNAHGQSGYKGIQNGHLAKLNFDRYKHLNQLWLSGGIYPYLSRNTSPTIIDRFRTMHSLNLDGLFPGAAGDGDNNALLNRLFEMVGNGMLNREAIEAMMRDDDQQAINILRNGNIFGARDEEDEEDDDEIDDDDDEEYDSEENPFVNNPAARGGIADILARLVPGAFQASDNEEGSEDESDEDFEVGSENDEDLDEFFHDADEGLNMDDDDDNDHDAEFDDGFEDYDEDEVMHFINEVDDGEDRDEHDEEDPDVYTELHSLD